MDGFFIVSVGRSVLFSSNSCSGSGRSPVQCGHRVALVLIISSQ